MLAMQTPIEQTGCYGLFNQQRVLIVGLGKTGLSCAQFLARRGIAFAMMDSRAQPPGVEELRRMFPDVELSLGGLDPALISRSDVLVISPGVALREPELRAAREQGKTLVGDVEIFARCINKPVVAITGSNGKSTVTTLLGEMARLAGKNTVVAGNIGLPVLDAIDASNNAELYVLELSSFQLETTDSLNACASTVLNISEDHMDRYDTLSDYARAKLAILNGNGEVIINRDDLWLSSQLPALAAERCRSFGLDMPPSEKDFGLMMHNHESWLAMGTTPLVAVSRMKLRGTHNIANALAALALGQAAGLPVPAMLEALQTFTGLAHRTQWVASIQDVNWFNDSKATNVGAALAAIKGMSEHPQILLLGGQGKGQDFLPLRAAVEQHARAVILFGEDADKIKAALGDQVHCHDVSSLQEAVRTAHQLAQPGDVVLLSPACASFDMFNGYEHRGNEFMHLVEALIP